MWRPTTNIGLVIAARAAFDAAAANTQITWLHIFGYTGEQLKKRTDALAKYGATNGEYGSGTQTLARILLDTG